MDNLSFGAALQLLKEGKKMTRGGWNGNKLAVHHADPQQRSRNMFIYLVRGSTFPVNRPPLLGFYPEGTEITYLPHIDMRTATGECVPWVASHTDLLATDWEIVD